MCPTQKLCEPAAVDLCRLNAVKQKGPCKRRLGGFRLEGFGSFGFSKGLGNAQINIRKQESQVAYPSLPRRETQLRKTSIFHTRLISAKDVGVTRENPERKSWHVLGSATEPYHPGILVHESTHEEPNCCNMLGPRVT